jgi:sec-independent protein translocase protein TatA
MLLTHGVLDALGFIESPMQIGLVLMIALILFGPKRLPEIGKQIGTAIRDLRKAARDMAGNFNIDHEPDGTNPPYTPTQDYARTEPYYGVSHSSDDQPDLTDYTLTGNLARKASKPAATAPGEDEPTA